MRRVLKAAFGKAALQICGATVAMASVGYSVRDLGDVVSPPHVPSAYDAQEYAASTSLLGQFRTSVSSWLWLRTDSYMHNGVELRQMTDDEIRAGIRSDSPAPDGEQQIRNEAHVVTTIPSAARDFRGVFGDMERAIAPYKDMYNHKHNDPMVTLPLFRLMTWIDPSFIPGWVDGAAVMSRDHAMQSTLVALSYLEQGQKDAPYSVAILVEMGELWITRMKNLPKAVNYLEEAREVGKNPKNLLDPTEKDALEQGYRWLCLSYRDLNELSLMRSSAVEGLEKFPDDGVLMHLLFPPPLLLQPKYRDQWQKNQWKQLQRGGELGEVPS